MSDLPGLLDIAEDNTVSEVRLSPNTLAVLLYALDKVYDWRVWQDYEGEVIPDTDIETIHDLVEEASYEVMNAIVTTPVGATMIWHTDTPPDRWIICDGSGVLKTEYPELYALLGGKYGESTDFFGVPNLFGRSPFGANFSVELDEEAGALTHTLITAEIPAHNHGVTDPGHTHTFPRRTTFGAAAPVSAYPGQVASVSDGVTNSNTTGVSIGNTGGGGAHNNLHPVLGVNFIIYGGRA